MRLVLTLLFALSLIIGLCLPCLSAEGYWQQEVNYKIDVTLGADLRTIEGTCRIQYINNSPDTLRELYIKAFPNAVQPGSYMDKKQRETGDFEFASLAKESQGSLAISEFEFHQGLTSQLGPQSSDNTIWHLNLLNSAGSINGEPVGILPGDTVNLEVSFVTVLPFPHTARMGVYGGVTKAAYWYPAVCVYDRKLGWNNSQYLGWGEWYGDYGTFEVNITAPEDVVIAATGELVNESEVLPDSLKQLLRLENYTQPRQVWPQFSYDSSKTKTWRFLARNVPDFSFVGSRNYCLDEVNVGGVRVIAYALRQNANRWKDAAEDGAKAIETLSELYIPYQWPVMRICDAFAGMEFPMLVHCAGGPPSPGWYVVLWHEIAHNWFMGMIGSNQTDRPFLDEGFTTHAEHVVMEKYRGRYTNMNNHRTWYAREFAPNDEDRDNRGSRPLLLLMTEGYDKPMVFSYDQGEEYWPYRVSAYYKSAAMHYNLRSILGDSAYFKAMQEYCRTWLFKHPYEEDFHESMERSTRLELDPFFQQWYHGRQRLDYAFGGRKTKKSGHGFEHRITLKNAGRFVSPVDVAVVLDNSDTAHYTVSPEGMAYTKAGYTQLPAWNQFRRFDEKYEFVVRSPQQVKKVVVDPQNLLMDINRMNNQSGRVPPVQVRFDNMKYDLTPVNQYALRWRPDVWYDEPNGMQLGLHLHGSYLQHERKFRLDSRIGTESGRPMVDVEGALPFQSWGPGREFSQRFLVADYRTFSRTSYTREYKKLWSRPDRTFFGVDFEVLDVSGEQENRRDPLPDKLLPYLPDPAWDAGTTYRATIHTGGHWTFRYGTVSAVSHNSLGGHSYGGSDRGFEESQTRFDLELTRGDRRWLKTSAEYVLASGEPPSHRLNHLSRPSSMERLTSSQVFRSPGTFPVEWEDDFYLGAERVRGYQDRALWFVRSFSGSVEVAPFGRLPIPLVKKIPAVGGFLSKLNVALFADAATISMKGKEQLYRLPMAENETLKEDGSEIFASAGLSVTMPPVWSNQRVRLDFPFYLSKPLPGDDEFEFRFSVAWIMPSLY